MKTGKLKERDKSKDLMGVSFAQYTDNRKWAMWEQDS